MKSFELFPFNLSERINLDEKHGLFLVHKSDDGKIVLVTDGTYIPIDETPSPATIANLDAVLGFVLDIGIRREKELTLTSGFYTGHALVQPQSSRVVGQSDFDASTFDRVKQAINRCYQSGDSDKEAMAIRTNHLIVAYNDSRLLFPSFYNESYLGLMRILDSISGTWGSDQFSISAASVSSALNEEIYQKISQIGAYSVRLDAASEVFDERLANAKEKNNELEKTMTALDRNARLIFSCFYSAYQYRNKFVHQGFPFPSLVKENLSPAGDDSGMAYLHAALAMSLTKRHSFPGRSEDLIDIHAVIQDPGQATAFRDRYFKLVPSWHFVRRVAKQALLNRIEQLASSEALCEM